MGREGVLASDFERKYIAGDDDVKQMHIGMAD